MLVYFLLLRFLLQLLLLLLLLLCLFCVSYHLEKKLHIHRISDIFLTSLSPHSVAGLVGLLLSLEGTGATSVTIWGPYGVKPLLQLAMRSFAGL